LKTFIPKPKDIHRGWVLIDAEGQRLGRLATRVATILRGKHRPTFTPLLDTGDFVVIVNADKVALTGRKLEQKTYYHHTGYPGGMRFTPVKRVLEDNPERVLRKAVWGMLPKGPLGRRLIGKLKIYAGPKHPHAAQKPEAIAV